MYDTEESKPVSVTVNFLLLSEYSIILLLIVLSESLIPLQNKTRPSLSVHDAAPATAIGDVVIESTDVGLL